MIGPEAARLLKLLGLAPYADRACGSYSGGNRRKLSVAAPLVGGAQVGRGRLGRLGAGASRSLHFCAHACALLLLLLLLTTPPLPSYHTPLSNPCSHNFGPR